MNPRIRANVAALTAYTPGEQPDDPTIVKLNTNENPYPPSPAALKALQALGADPLRLYPDPQCRALRQAIADLHGCAPEQVICGNGSDELLALCFRAFVPDHGKVGYFDPSYSLYPVLAAIADCGVAPLPLAADFQWPAIAAEYDVPLFFWTNPNAPTSLACAADVIRAYAERSEGVVVVDEAYVDFAEQDCMGLALALPNLLVTRSLSKSYGLAGARLGYAVGSVELIEALHKIKDAYNVNRMTQEVAAAAVRDQGYMREQVTRIKQTRARVTTALEARGFRVWPSQTNFLWVQPPPPAASEWFARLRERGVVIRYFTAPACCDYLRISIGTDAQMDRLLAALDA
jgi:histidinol-phosphate aminotransferase